MLLGREFLSLLACSVLLALATPVFAQEESDAVEDDEPHVAIPIAEAREQLKRILPPGASRADETAFLVQRERAAFSLGQSKVRLDALRRLVEIHQGTPEVRKYWISLWREEFRSGNQQRAFDIGEQIAAHQGWEPRQRCQNAAHLGMDYVQERQRAKAERMLRQTRTIHEELRGSAPAFADYCKTLGDYLQAMLFRGEGRYAEAETAYRSALAGNARELERTRGLARQGDGIDAFAIRQRLQHTIQGSYVTLLAAEGKHVEAEATARQGLQQATADNTLGATLGYWNARIGQALLGQRRYADALATLDRALEMYANAGLAPSSERLTRARIFRLQSLMGMEKWAEADAEYSAMLAAAEDDQASRRLVASDTLRALLHAMNGRSEEALRIVDRVVRNRTRVYGGTHPYTAEAKAVRAMVLQTQGAAGPAIAAYGETFGAVFAPEVSYDEAAPRGVRGYFLPLALRSYLRLVADQAAANGGQARPDTIADAFTVADRLRDSRVQQALVDSSTRTLAVNRPELFALVRTEQDLRSRQRDGYRDVTQKLAEITDAEAEIKAAARSEKDTAEARARRKSATDALDAARKQIAALDAERRAVQQEIARKFPAYASFVHPPAVRPAAIAEKLAPDEALISIYSADARTFVWMLRAGREPSLHVAALGEDEIARSVARLRRALDIGHLKDPVGASYDFATAHRLYRDLIEPSAAALAGAKVITIVAGGALGQIPFSALVKGPAGERAFDSAPWLIKEYAISHIASASSWLALRGSAGKARAAQPFFGVGDPQFAPGGPTGVAASVRMLVAATKDDLALDYAQLPPLPETRDEIIAIAKALGANPKTDTLFGAAASRTNVMSKPLLDRRVVAFATHGLRAGELPSLSQPALALASAGGADESPLLTLDDVLKLQLQADWVVLSACNTAAADGRSEEAISGLGRGFFYAGARSVLLTHWAVESTSAQALVTAVFQHYAGPKTPPRAESLRQAQLDMLAGKFGPQFRHPFFWSPYALVGDAVR